MTTQRSLLLDLWRETCRHLSLKASAPNLLQQLRPLLGVETLMIRRLAPDRGWLETVVQEGVEELQAVQVGRSKPEGWLSFVRSGRSEGIFNGSVGELEERFPDLLPVGLEGYCLAALLGEEETPIGALILLSSNPFTEAQKAQLQPLLEPFTVALENDRRLRELSTLREAAEADRNSLLTRLKRQDIADTIIGAETGLKPVMERVKLVGPTDTPVLILGETGTGKEVVARAIHRHSRRVSGPFLRVNCGAIPPELIDSELFGHERGSFTGAVATHKGWFERADGGSLFLDEVGELSPAAQVRLLRILQDGTFQRVGGQQTLSADVRLIAATNRDLKAMVAEGGFRKDLWYRISVFPIALPSLAERPEDIPTLAYHFALRAAERLGLAMQTPTQADLAVLAAYGWPGNVRELAAVMERAAILGDGRRLEVAAALGVAQLPGSFAKPPATPALHEEQPGFASYDEMARQHIEAVLARTAGRVEGPFGAARILGLNPNTLRTRMRRLGVIPRHFRQR